MYRPFIVKVSVLGYNFQLCSAILSFLNRGTMSVEEKPSDYHGRLQSL